MSVSAVTMPGGPELLIILLIFVLLFGARKLPDLGSSVGKTIKNFKRGVSEAEADEEPESEPSNADAASPASPASRDGQ